MVAKIAILKRLLDALNYNEKKVEKGKAECIYAGNYLPEVNAMNFYDKLLPLKNRDELNSRATTKTLHVSLNFHPSENLTDEKLCNIANVYMQEIGFGDQPYLVYKHCDAGHPHVHIVSTAINEDGSRINTHNIGKLKSEKARRQIEESFNLIRASSKETKTPDLLNVKIEQLRYGKAETKSSINRVVNLVLQQYAFTSLPEFNAALRQFNVVADRGCENSRIFKNRGLVYRILDSSGSKTGVPIKASLLSCKPTLTNLEAQFILNIEKKQIAKLKVKATLERCLQTHPNGMQSFLQKLKDNNVYTLLRQNSDGRIYGITFVDNETKCVFNGSDLGKSYSIASLQDQLRKNALPATKTEQKSLIPAEHRTLGPNTEKHMNPFEELLNPLPDNQNIPAEFKRKKKRRKNNDNN